MHGKWISNYLQSLVQFGCFCCCSQKIHNVDITISRLNTFSSALYRVKFCSLVVSIGCDPILRFTFSDNCKCLSPYYKVRFPFRMTLILVTSAFKFGSWSAIKWVVFTTLPPATFSTMWWKLSTQKYVSNMSLSAEDSNGRAFGLSLLVLFLFRM